MVYGIKELLQVKVYAICITLVNNFFGTEQRVVCRTVRAEAITACTELRFID